MSATAAGLEARRRGSVLAGDLPGLSVRAIFVVGAALLLIALALTLLVASSDVPAAGHAGTWNMLMRLLAMAVLLPLGALMVARVPRNAIGWLLCATSMGVGLAIAAQEYATYSHFVQRLPAEQWVGWVGEWAAAPMIALVTVSPLVFPTGRLLSRRWRPALWLAVAAPVLLLVHGALGVGEELGFLGNPISNGRVLANVGDAGSLGWFAMVPATVLGIAALRIRRRTADAETAAQLQLIVRAAIVVGFGFAACLIASFLAPASDLGAAAWWFSLAFLGGAMAVAILRHRLYGSTSTSTALSSTRR